MHFLLFCLSVGWSIHLHAEMELVDRNLTKMPLWASSSVSAALVVFVISVAPSFLVQTEAGCSCSTAPPKVKGLAIHPCGWNSKRKILLLFSSSVMFDSLRPHGLQHARLPCPSPSPGACSRSRLLSWWCHPSHPLLSPSPPAFNPSQHQGLFQWVSSSHQVVKVLELQLQHQSC